MIIDKNGGVDNRVNRANTIYIWQELSGSDQHGPYMVSNMLVLVTKVGDINFPPI